MRLTGGGSFFNASLDILATGCSESTINCTIHSQSYRSEVALSVAQRRWGTVSNASVISVGSISTFTLALSSSLAILIAFCSQFVWQTIRVSIGNIPCSEIHSSTDGHWLAFERQARWTCAERASSTRDCGYQPLQLSNTDSGSTKPAQLVCPTILPGSSRFVNKYTFTSIVYHNSFYVCRCVDCTACCTKIEFLRQRISPRCNSCSRAVGAPRGRNNDDDLSGRFYSLACSASGLYTDPLSGACGNASDPLSFLCAFGSGDNCRLCPSGGMCPGGTRCWTRPGYFSASEFTDAVTACPPPAATERCAGWGSTTASTIRGPGYLSGSYVCSACDRGYFAVGDGTCSVCPDIPNKAAIYTGFMTLVGGDIVFAAAVYIGLYAIVRWAGGTIVGGFSRLVGLMHGLS